MMAQKSFSLCREPSTLVYTLLDPRACTFEQFFLLVKGNHSHMVDDFIPFKSTQTVHVKLQYQASVANATAKLGHLASIVSVSKLNNHIREDEYAELHRLQQHFKIGSATSHPAPIIPVIPKPIRKRGTFAATRPTPYKPKKSTPKQPTSVVSEEEEDAVNYIPDTQECEVTYLPNESENIQSGFYIRDPTEN